MKTNLDLDLAVATLIAASMITVFYAISSALSLIVTFIPGVILAYIFYWLFCHKDNPDSKAILPLYFSGIGFQLIHFAEEHATHFEIDFPCLFHGQPYGHNLFVTFNMIAYFMFMLGGYGIYKGIKPLMMPAMFFIAYGMLGNCIGHIAFALAVHGYFPGLYSSFPNFILGILIVIKLGQKRFARASGQ